MKKSSSASEQFSAMLLNAASIEICIRRDESNALPSLMSFDDVSILYRSTNVMVLCGSLSIGAMSKIDSGLFPISSNRW